MSKRYRIILVDDEEEVRTSIIRKINWEAAGFEVVGDAENGEDALELIDAIEPELVLTDIRMPYMDGLTLSRIIRQKYPSIKIIIFSGFDDFEYAKQAIQLNIIEYILKPVNAEELTAILNRIKATLDNEAQQIRDIDALRQSFTKSLPTLQENFLKNLIHGHIDDDKINILLKEYHLEIGNAKSWTIIQVSIDKSPDFSRSSSFEQEQELIPLSVTRLLAYHLKTCCQYEIFNSSIGLCAIIGMDDENSLESVISALRSACHEGLRILSLYLSIGVGQPCTNLADIEACYRQAREAMGYKAIIGSGSVIYIQDVEPSSKVPQMDSKIESDLAAAIKFGTSAQIEQCIQQILEKAAYTQIHTVDHQTYLISIMNLLLQIIQRYELVAEDIFSEKSDIFDILVGLQNDEELRQWMNKVCKRINTRINAGRENSTQSLIRSAKQYIEENYNDPDISLETLCSYLHISTAYFSTIFKREVGESYTAYLTRVRLEKAVDLLNRTDEKTYIIARKVGYEEPNYFGYVFKKQYGVSPSKFRGQS